MPYVIVYRQTTNVSSALKWLLFSSIFLVIAGVLLLVGRLRGVFSDQDLSIKEEREEFYIVALILAFSYLLISMMYKGLFFHLSIVSLGIFMGMLIFTFVNIYLKASIHMAVSCAFVLSIAIFYGVNTLIVLFWVLPLVAWSRLKLKKHTPKELLTGSILGTVITLLTFLIAKQIL